MLFGEGVTERIQPPSACPPKVKRTSNSMFLGNALVLSSEIAERVLSNLKLPCFDRFKR